MNQIKSGVVLSYASLAINNIVTILYTPILLRYLGQSEYGLYSIVTSVIAYLTIMDLGLGNTIIRYSALYKSQSQMDKMYNLFGLFIRIYSIISIIVLFIGGIVFFYLDTLFGMNFTEIELRRVKIMFIVTVLNLIITFPLSVFSSIVIAYQRFVFQKTLNVLRIIAQPIIMIPLLLLGYKAISLIVVVSLLNLTTLLLNMFYCFKVLKIRVIFGFIDNAILKEIFTFAFFIFLGVAVDKMNWSTGQVILGIYCGPEIVAVYAVAIQILLCYFGFASSMSGIFLPKITELITHKDFEKDVSDLFLKIGRLQYVILLLVCMGFIFFGKDFVTFWAGENYTDAYYVSLIIMFPLTFTAIQHTGVLILQAMNRQKVRSILYFVIALVNILFCVLLVPKYEMYGCAIAFSVCMFIGNILIMNVYYKREIHIDIMRFWKEIASSIPLIFVMIISGMIINNLMPIYSINVLLIDIALFVILYALFSFVLFMNSYEKKMLLSFLKICKK